MDVCWYHLDGRLGQVIRNNSFPPHLNTEVAVSCQNPELGKLPRRSRELDRRGNLPNTLPVGSFTYGATAAIAGLTCVCLAAPAT